MTLKGAECDSFYAQQAFQMPGEEPCVGLYCPRCGDTTNAPLAWVALRPGEHLGCPSCGAIYALPMVVA